MNPTSRAERMGIRLDGLLRAAAGGDEDAFLHLVDRCDGQLRRLASALIGDEPGDQLMQDVWRTALRRWSADTVAEPEAVRAWLCTLVVELARARGALADAGSVPGPSVAADRFLPAGHRWAGHWAVPPVRWNAKAAGPDAAAAVRHAVGALPVVAARAVTILRDVDGFPGPVVAQILAIDEADERRLLHVGRTAAREALEGVLAPA